ncbi:hypothetical protein ONS96_014954 [Cadophora gregata f. sp. sojae]|nr:hypothetical protein ONS96_014954 [Cadophora gregata f. sp. sojae]
MSCEFRVIETFCDSRCKSLYISTIPTWRTYLLQGIVPNHPLLLILVQNFIAYKSPSTYYVNPSFPAAYANGDFLLSYKSGSACVLRYSGSLIHVRLKSMQSEKNAPRACGCRIMESIFCWYTSGAVSVPMPFTRIILIARVMTDMSTLTAVAKSSALIDPSRGSRPKAPIWVKVDSAAVTAILSAHRVTVSYGSSSCVRTLLVCLRRARCSAGVGLILILLSAATNFSASMSALLIGFDILGRVLGELRTSNGVYQK